MRLNRNKNPYLINYTDLGFNTHDLHSGNTIVDLTFIERREVFRCHTYVKTEGILYKVEAGNQIFISSTLTAAVNFAKAALLDFAEAELMKTLEISTAIAMHRVEQATKFNEEIRLRRIDELIDDMRWTLNRQLSAVHSSAVFNLRGTPEGQVLYYTQFKML